MNLKIDEAMEARIIENYEKYKSSLPPEDALYNWFIVSGMVHRHSIAGLLDLLRQVCEEADQPAIVTILTLLELATKGIASVPEHSENLDQTVTAYSWWFRDMLEFTLRQRAAAVRGDQSWK